LDRETREKNTKGAKGIAGGMASSSPDPGRGPRGTAKGQHAFEPLSHAVIGACIDVQRQLGLHCMEVDYQRALELAFPKHGLQFEREVEVAIAYDGIVVTKRRADFIVSNATHDLLLETKARSTILPEDVEQCLLYLHQGGHKLCLLVNFGQRPLGIRRFVQTTR
jgi:GxxExxY protein